MVRGLFFMPTKTYIMDNSIKTAEVDLASIHDSRGRDILDIDKMIRWRDKVSYSM